MIRGGARGGPSWCAETVESAANQLQYLALLSCCGIVHETFDESLYSFVRGKKRTNKQVLCAITNDHMRMTRSISACARRGTGCILLLRY